MGHLCPHLPVVAQSATLLYYMENFGTQSEETYLGREGLSLSTHQLLCKWTFPFTRTKSLPISLSLCGLCPSPSVARSLLRHTEVPGAVGLGCRSPESPHPRAWATASRFLPRAAPSALL